MQLKTLVVSLFVALAAADSLDDIAAQFPSCAKTCLEDGSKQAGCATTDYSCQCSKVNEITTNSLQCITAGCSTDDITKTTQISTELCLAVANQAAGSAVSSLTDAAGSAFTSATAAGGSAFTSATGAAGSAFTSATAAAGSAHSSATASTSPTATPAAANHAVAGMGAFGAAAMFALAL